MSKTRNCMLCKQDVRFSLDMSNVQLGKMFGVSKDTARRHRKHLTEDSFFGVPVEQITSRGITRRLDDGSYEKITWNPNAKTLADAKPHVVKSLKLTFETPLPPVYDIRETVPFTKVVVPTDFQVGKVDVNGGTEELKQRVEASLAGIEQDIIREKPEEILIADAGDIIENFFNVSTQDQTNDLHLVNQILTAAEIMSGFIKRLAAHAPRVVFAVAPSNHCTVRKGFKSPSSTPDNDFGLMIQEIIRRELDGRPEYAHIHFVKPRNAFEEFVVYASPVSGTVFGVVHGHQVNKPHMLGDWLTNQVGDKESPLRDVDVLIAGHFHSFTIYQCRGRWIIVGTSSDGGSSWFTTLSGQRSTAGVTVFSTIGSRWFSPNIY